MLIHPLVILMKFTLPNPIENGISNSILNPGQISSYLILGNQYNVQFGYLTKSNLSFDFRYGKSMPE